MSQEEVKTEVPKVPGARLIETSKAPMHDFELEWPDSLPYTFKHHLMLTTIIICLLAVHAFNFHFILSKIY